MKRDFQVECPPLKAAICWAVERLKNHWVWQHDPSTAQNGRFASFSRFCLSVCLFLSLYHSPRLTHFIFLFVHLFLSNSSVKLPCYPSIKKRKHIDQEFISGGGPYKSPYISFHRMWRHDCLRILTNLTLLTSKTFIYTLFTFPPSSTFELLPHCTYIDWWV